MKGGGADRLLKWVCLLAVILMLSACASARKKFLGTTEANVGMFADTTLAMVGDPEFGFVRGSAIYIKVFLNLDEEEEKNFVNAMRRAELVMAAMVEYSFTIVNFVESEPEPEGRVRLYAEYISAFEDKVIKALGLDADHYEAIIEDVRDQKKFMDALKAAQPIINGLGRYMHLALTDMSKALDAWAEKVDKKIDTKYAEVIRYQEDLESEKYEILATMGQLGLAAKGDKEAYKRALAKGTILSKEVIPRGSSASYEELTEIWKYLGERLDGIDRIWKEIEPDWTTYRETHRELDQLISKSKREMTRVRLTTLVWVRAHQKMASGKFSPAEWFNIKDTPAMLIGVGAKAVF
jgi:hypothetical protein